MYVVCVEYQVYGFISCDLSFFLLLDIGNIQGTQWSPYNKTNLFIFNVYYFIVYEVQSELMANDLFTLMKKYWNGVWTKFSDTQ